MKTKETILLLILLVTVSATAQNFKLTHKIDVAGNEGWDYLAVNEKAQQLFVSHGSVVNVIDLHTDQTIATIPDTNGVHGIAMANNLNKAFITDGKDNAVTVINLSTFALIEKVQIKGIKPDAVLYDEYSAKVFVYNAKSNDATVLNANTNQVVATIPLFGKPEFSVTDGKGHVFVNIEDKNQIKVIDTATLKVVNTWSIAPGDEPSGLAIDIEQHRLFSVCGNKMMVVTDSETGKIIQTLPIGDRCDGVAFDEKRKLILSSNGEGTITVVKEESKDKFAVIETVKTQLGARTITLNKTTGKIYTPTAAYGKIPDATPENQHPRPEIIAGSFKILVIEAL